MAVVAIRKSNATPLFPSVGRRDDFGLHCVWDNRHLDDDVCAPCSGRHSPAQGFFEGRVSERERSERAFRKTSILLGLHQLLNFQLNFVCLARLVRLVRSCIIKNSPRFARRRPWTYRLASIVIMFPFYPLLLVTVGTAAGRHVYFKHFAVKMLSRFGIPPRQLDSHYDPTKVFRKW